jgi:serine/threonine protein kinase
MALLRANQEFTHSLDPTRRFRVVGKLGEGGFGEAYEVVGIELDGTVAAGPFCLKITEHATAWHGEVFFMNFLANHRHAMHIFESFPVVLGRGKTSKMCFVITMPVMDLNVSKACRLDVLPWPEERVTRQLRFLLDALAQLHRISAPHRDITPMNVYIGDRNSLILGDYGIAAIPTLYRGVRANGVYNPAFRPPDLKTYWDVRDDIDQVGLLCATLLTGQVWEAGVKKPEINKITSDVPLRNIIKTALSVKSQRYADASEMAAALALV